MRSANLSGEPMRSGRPYTRREARSESNYGGLGQVAQRDEVERLVDAEDRTARKRLVR
jgi:hypothetical protein